MKSVFSLRMELDEVIHSEEYEQLIFENLERCKRIFGIKFKVVFWHRDLDQKVIDNFVKRNEKTLFKLGTKITGKSGDVWFLIKSSEEEKSSWRFRWEGDILQGIVEYLRMVSHIFKRDNK